MCCTSGIFVYGTRVTGEGGVGPTCHDRGCSTGGSCNLPTHPRGSSRSSHTPARYPCPLCPFQPVMARICSEQRHHIRSRQTGLTSECVKKKKATPERTSMRIGTHFLPLPFSSFPLPHKHKFKLKPNSHSQSFVQKSKCRAPGKRVAIDHNPNSETSWVAASKSESASQLHRQGQEKLH